jgi:hypothetical protein
MRSLVLGLSLVTITACATGNGVSKTQTEITRKVATEETMPVQAFIRECDEPELRFCTNNFMANKRSSFFEYFDAKINEVKITNGAFVVCTKGKGRGFSLSFSEVRSLEELRNLHWFLSQMKPEIVVKPELCPSGESRTISDRERKF